LGLEHVKDRSDVVRLIGSLANGTDHPLIQLLSLDLSDSFLKRANERWPDSSNSAPTISAFLQRSEIDLAQLRTLHDKRLNFRETLGIAEKALFHRFTQAYFDQKQVANFCLSRHEKTPLSLGNATAGLPLIVCEQSMRRCIELQEDGKLAKSNDNSQFAISCLTRSLVRHLQKRVATQADASSKREIATKWLRNCHIDFKESLRELRNHRPALLDAVEVSYVPEHDPNDFGYAIAREYFRLVREREYLRNTAVEGT
jgi:hypothetical protein